MERTPPCRDARITVTDRETQAQYLLGHIFLPGHRSPAKAGKALERSGEQMNGQAPPRLFPCLIIRIIDVYATLPRMLFVLGSCSPGCKGAAGANASPHRPLVSGKRTPFISVKIKKATDQEASTSEVFFLTYSEDGKKLMPGTENEGVGDLLKTWELPSR